MANTTTREPMPSKILAAYLATVEKPFAPGDELAWADAQLKRYEVPDQAAPARQIFFPDPLT